MSGYYEVDVTLHRGGQLAPRHTIFRAQSSVAAVAIANAAALAADVQFAPGHTVDRLPGSVPGRRFEWANPTPNGGRLVIALTKVRP